MNVSFFVFTRIYHNASACLLSNNAQFTEDYLTNSLQNVVDGIPDMRKNGFYCQDDYDTNNGFGQLVVRPLLQLFDVGHLCYVVHHYSHYSEIAIFGVPSAFTDFNRYFLANSQQFFKFLVYFKDAAKALIKQTKRAKIRLTSDELRLVSNNASAYKDKFCSLITDRKIDRYYLDNIAEELYLTHREAECLKLLRDGLNYYKIADKLSITRHTVQLHFNNIRIKLDCDSKKELIQKVKDSDILSVVSY